MLVGNLKVIFMVLQRKRYDYRVQLDTLSARPSVTEANRFLKKPFDENKMIML